MRRRSDPLVEAARERILRELRGEAARQSVINNYVGHPGHSQGVAEQMAQRHSEPDPGDYDYKVDITRTNTPEGWTKNVHRYREPKEPPLRAGPGGRVGKVTSKKKAMG